MGHMIFGNLGALSAVVDTEGDEERLEELQMRTPKARAILHADEHVLHHGKLQPPAAERLV